jgi:hypothetical protein
MITKQFFNKGSGGLWRLTAPMDMADELEAEAQTLRKSLDPWSSPTIDNRGEKDGQLFIDVKYYGMD